MNISDIEKIASETRLEFENGKVDRNKVIDLYWRKNPANRKFDVGSLSSTLNIFPYNNCGLVSVYLESLIPDSKVVEGKYGLRYHDFILVQESIIVDITADQFGGPKVYVGKLRSPWSLGV